MNAFRLLPAGIALGMLAAHFYRAQSWVPFGIVVALFPLLLIRAPWAARVLQAALVLGAIEWIRTTAVLVAMRHSMGQPYARLVIILGAVALVTGLCALIFQWRPVKERFGLAGVPLPEDHSVGE